MIIAFLSFELIIRIMKLPDKLFSHNGPRCIKPVKILIINYYHQIIFINWTIQVGLYLVNCCFLKSCD